MANLNLNQWQLSELPYELLEKNLGVDPSVFTEPSDFRSAMILAERCIARIEAVDPVDIHPLGTGFLIAPDLLITCYHVRADIPSRKRSFDSNPGAIRVRFGHIKNCRVSSRCYELHPTEWLVVESNETHLDFSVIRLAECAGEHQIGDDGRAPRRGWILPAKYYNKDGQSLFILQHPLGESLKLASGYMTSLHDNWVDYHVNTEHGSSGSPVFDCNWRCVALHSRAGEGVNRGVSFGAILDGLPITVRNELHPFQPSEITQDVNDSVIMTPGVSVDLSAVSLSVIQAIGSMLVKYATSAGMNDSIPPFDIKLEGGKHLRSFPSSIASDTFQLLALKGALDLLKTQIAALQYHQGNYQIDPQSLTVYPVIINRDIENIKSTGEEIRQRLEIMIDDFQLTRNR